MDRRLAEAGGVLESYLAHAGVSGLSYLGATWSRCTRIFWGLTFLAALAGMILALALLAQDWSDRPSITTLESVSVPVQEIPFPTVTVCPKAQPVDRWAYLEKAYNALQLPDPDCANCSEGARRLGRDFQVFLYWAGRAFLASAHSYLHRTTRQVSYDQTAPLESLRNVVYGLVDDAYEEVKKVVLPKKGPTAVGRIVGENVTLSMEVKEMAAAVFSRWENYSTFEALLKDRFGDHPESKEKEEEGSVGVLDLTSLGEQTGVAVRMLLLHHRTGEAARKGREDGFPTVGLGTLLANLMERPNYYHVGGSLGSWDFSSMPEHHWEDEEDRCFAGALDRKLHDLFSEVTLSLGVVASSLEEDGQRGRRNLSAFELPSLLELSYDAIGTLDFWDYRNSHPHFRCQDKSRNKAGRGRHGGYENELRTCYEAWKAVFGEGAEARRTHPCWNETMRSRCCQLSHVITRESLSPLMSLMKISRHLGHSPGPKRAELLAPLVRRGGAFAEYQVKEEEEEEEVDVFAQIPHCSFESERQSDAAIRVLRQRLEDSSGQPLPSCRSLLPAVTERGLCQAFNVPPPSDLMKPSPFLDALNGAFANELRSAEARRVRPGDSKRRLRLVLDRQGLLTSDRRNMREGRNLVGSFLVGVGSASDFSSVSSQSVKAAVGRGTEVVVTPSELAADSALGTLSPSTRGCRMPDEPPTAAAFSAVYRNYSQTNCQLECRVRAAVARCGCLPWDFPPPPSFSGGSEDDPGMCDHLGLLCFRNSMERGRDWEWVSHCYGSAACPSDCERRMYVVSSSTFRLDPVLECQPGSPLRRYARAKLRARSPPLVALYGYFVSRDPEKNSWTKLDTDYEGDFCEHLVRSEVAVVTVRLASPVYTRSVMTLRRTVADKASQVGGIFGLCAGASVITMVEMAYWAAKAARALCCGGGGGGGPSSKSTKVEDQSE